MFRFLLTGRKDRSILIMSDASTPRTHLLATAGDAVFTRGLRVGAKWASGECGRECCSRDREYRAQSHSRRGFRCSLRGFSIGSASWPSCIPGISQREHIDSLRTEMQFGKPKFQHGRIGGNAGVSLPRLRFSIKSDRLAI